MANENKLISVQTQEKNCCFQILFTLFHRRKAELSRDENNGLYTCWNPEHTGNGHQHTDGKHDHTGKNWHWTVQDRAGPHDMELHRKLQSRCGWAREPHTTSVYTGNPRTGLRHGKFRWASNTDQHHLAWNTGHQNRCRGSEQLNSNTHTGTHDTERQHVLWIRCGADTQPEQSCQPNERYPGMWSCNGKLLFRSRSVFFILLLGFSTKKTAVVSKLEWLVALCRTLLQQTSTEIGNVMCLVTLYSFDQHLHVPHSKWHKALQRD